MESLLTKIKNILHEVAPYAKVILFGSKARKDDTENSDVDLLIILKQESISRTEEKRILYPLYNLEFEEGKIISPIIITEKDWQKASHQTTFYHEVIKDGIVL